MPTGSAQWDVTRCWSFYPGGWHDEYSIQMDGTDTIINNKVYKKLILVTHHAPGTQFDSVYTNFLGGMRESGKQVFFISEYLCIDTFERMVYDFNEFETGDTIYTQVLTNGLLEPVPHIVTSIDSVLVGNENRRRIHLRDQDGFFTEYWIEGVGSSLGLVYASYWILTDNSYDLNCFYTEGQLQFTNPAPVYGFCLAPLPDIECELTSAVQPTTEKEISYKIYPNPTSEFVYIESNDDVRKVCIFNSYGQLVCAEAFKSEIETHALSPGFYFIQVWGKEGQMLSLQKLVKL